nr:nucleolar and coiled-body phosphoprotein 1-like [Aegilops tauschii subsp. strangulata]
MSGSGANGKWDASSVTDGDTLKLKEAGYFPTNVVHRAPEEGQIIPTPEPGERRRIREHEPEDPANVRHLYGTTPDKIWGKLFQPQKEWPVEGKDISLDAVNPPREGWLAKAKKIRGPAPLPEGPRSDQLEKLLVVVPYKAPAKKGKKKEGPEAREGLCRRVHPGNRSGDAAASSVQDGGEDENEEESASSHSKKRAASEDVEEVQPYPAPKRRCRPKLVLSDSSDFDKESEVSEKVLEKEPRVKPPASSPPHERPAEQTLEGASPPAKLANSGSMAHSAPPLIPGEVEEVRSQRTPPSPNTEGEADAVMAVVNTWVTEDQEGASLLADG